MVILVMVVLVTSVSLNATIFVDTETAYGMNTEGKDEDEFQHLHDETEDGERKSNQTSENEGSDTSVNIGSSESWNSSALGDRYLKNISARYYMEPHREATDIKINGSQKMWLGHNLSWLGDANGNGYDDFVLGAPNNDSAKGAAFIFFGYAGFSLGEIDVTEANVTINGVSNGDKLGWDVAGAGDATGNGYNDAVVGAPGAGNVYVFEG
ncbi:MAG: hypothetical protein KGY76_08715, partial [Candidatus Thermoplasmatota archaeon]|nr:hypothetical protein [Candidatus Thermoplasmatota archaeon]